MNQIMSPIGIMGIHSGGQIDLQMCDISQLKIEDVARGLSKVKRFAGQDDTDEGYSVATHSLFVESLLRQRMGKSNIAFAGLLHDAAEGVTGVDMPRPIKALFPAYATWEHELQLRLFTYFGVVWNEEVAAAVKWADDTACLSEGIVLLPEQVRLWQTDGFCPKPLHRKQQSAAEARIEFLERFHEYRPA